MPALPASDFERAFREEYGRAVAVLVHVFGDIDVTEAVQDAFTAAVQRWPSTGLPPSPAGWIITTARNRAIDRLRREASRADRYAEAALLHARDEPAEEGPVRDDRLRPIFTCCHPALATGVQVAPATDWRQILQLYDPARLIRPEPRRGPQPRGRGGRGPHRRCSVDASS